MKRISIVVILACALLGAGFYAWKSQQEVDVKSFSCDKKVIMNGTDGTVVYAIRDVGEGGVITADALEQRDIEQSKIPKDAILKPEDAVGMKAKYGLSQGQIVSSYDLILDQAGTIRPK